MPYLVDAIATPLFCQSNTPRGDGEMPIAVRIKILMYVNKRTLKF